MTLVQALAQTPPRTAVRTAVAGTAEEAGPRVWADMTVEVALCVMAGARVRHLVVCDADDKRTDLVTRSGLTAVRDGSGYTDRIRLRDIIDGSGRVTSPPTP
ncbi:CBS domain-containing protein [Streptomyces sp. NPDC018584]|uniref:CBS domain-containing protein n=1 Tax=unclassified Streptomyces TaxID=2593676 RepID=UPI0037B8A7F1